MGHCNVTYVTPKLKIGDKKAKMLMKIPQDELKNVFAMKLNVQSLRIYKTTLHSAKPIFSRF